MTEPIRWGILGCGRIVQRRMLPAFAEVPEGTIHAIASERAGVAERLADEYRVPQAAASYQEILNDPEIDAVYVPCSGELHHRWTLAAAEAGKHVLCEKPLATTLREAEEMVRACKGAGVLLQEAFMWRHHPRAARVKQLVHEGTIGELRLIVANFSFELPADDWRMRPERGGGAMWDLGCYGVNCCRFLSGSEPERITADAHWGPSGVDLTMRIGLAFPNRLLANIDCSFEAPFRSRAEFVGTRGRIVLERAFQPDQDSTIRLWRSTGRDAVPEVLTVAGESQYACQIRDFCRSIRAGRLLPPAEEGLENTRVMEQILASAR